MRLILAVAACALFAGCGADRDVEDGDGESTARVDSPIAENSFTAADGIDVSTNADVDLPAGITVYPGAKVTTTMAAPDAGGFAMVGIGTDDPAQKVADHYRLQLRDAGYTVTSAPGDSATVEGEHPTQGSLSISVMETGIRTEAMITISG